MIDPTTENKTHARIIITPSKTEKNVKTHDKITLMCKTSLQATRPDSLWRSRPFRSFYSAQVVSYFGDSMLTLALPFLVLQLTGSGILMGVVGMAETLPLFLFAIPAGLLADWGDRHHTR
jgi:hypothetical protein